MLIRADCIRNWVVRFRIFNWESVSIAGLRPGMVLALSSRFLSEKNWRILRRNSLFYGQDSSMWREFSMAAHLKRLLGSASGSIVPGSHLYATFFARVGSRPCRKLVSGHVIWL
jgi:hypothetical protein